MHAWLMHAQPCPVPVCSYKDKSVQRDAKMVSYDVVDKAQKPYVEVDVAGQKKVCNAGHEQLQLKLRCMMGCMWCAAHLLQCKPWQNDTLLAPAQLMPCMLRRASRLRRSAP